MKLYLDTNIKSWYRVNFSEDELGHEIRDITFLELFKNIDRGICPYDTIRVQDSIIRERLFEALANIFQTDYNYIYKKWLNNN
jgi:ATP-dependent RNA circularization protein (DNA/RNA ligase family)